MYLSPPKAAAMRVALGYFMIGIFWLILTDVLVLNLTNAPHLQSISLSLLIIISTAFFYGLLRRSYAEIELKSFQLLKEKQWLEAILQQIPSGVVLAAEPSGKIFISNKASNEILKITTEAALTLDDYISSIKGIHPDGSLYKPSEWPLARSLFSEEFISNEEIEILRKDGTHCLMLTNSAPLFDTQKKLIGGIASFFDITSQRNSEKLLQESLQKYHILLDTIDGIVWEATSDLRFTFVSKQAERLLGYPKEAWLDSPTFWADHIHIEDRDSTIKTCLAQSKKMLPHDLEYRMYTAAGGTIWVRDIVTVVTKNNKFIGLRGIMVDITAYKNTTFELERSLSLLNAIIESTADGLMVVDLNGNIMRYNQKFVKLWQIPEKILDKKDDSLTIQYILGQIKNPDQFLEKIKEIYESPEMESTDVIDFKDGKRIERFSQPQSIDGKSVGRVWSFRDVTEKSRVAQERENILEQEREARRGIEKSIQLRDDFISIASHELRIPLTPIRICLQLLKRHIYTMSPGDVKSEVLFKALENADKQFDRFLMLVENLLDVSRISADRLILEYEEFDLSELVTEVVERFTPQFSKVGCQVKLKSQTPIIGNWDRARIDQVISNLLTNAMKYGEGKPIYITVSLSGNQAFIIIRDFGIGISKEDQPKLFGRFERTASVKHFEGLGLGLFISHNIISALGGNISFESNAGEGATFTVELPVTKSN
ncbi:MAG: PAS domain S-box protein [Bacteriovorax sp.]|nr:PAS domain S-box protein [Bacteriovorax sp.]